MKKMIYIFILVIFVSGCNTLTHLDQLLALKGIGDEQALMDKDVKFSDANFKKLLAEVKGLQFKTNYPTQEAVVKSFGEPIFSRPETINNQPVNFLLYRRSAEYFKSEKVYLYFDLSGKLIDYKLVENPS